MKVKVFGGIIEGTPEVMEWLKDYDPEQYKKLTKNEKQTKPTTKKDK